jgi:D-serine deaminase-like pyridoxal phosphate-dependent protein
MSGDVDTPVITIDLDAVDRNIARMQQYCDDHGIGLRAHVKTHKMSRLVQLQAEAGAIGIAAQKLGEAEALATDGLDVLVSFPLIGAVKSERLAALAATCPVTVAVDSETGVRDLSRALHAAGAEAKVLIDCDTGLGRTGLQTPESVVDLAAVVDRLPGLRFVGLFTHPAPPDQSWLPQARAAVENHGLDVTTISVGGTARAFHTHQLPNVTELRVGTYIFGDRACVANESTRVEDCALRILATVVSRPTKTRATLDAGSKTLTSDRARGCDPNSFGLLIEYPEARIAGLYEEHAVVEFQAHASTPDLGEVVTIVPNHACGVVNLHDQADVYRAGVNVGTWPIDARGRTR